MKLINRKTRDDNNIIPGYKYIISCIITAGVMLCPFAAHLKVYKLSSAGQTLFEQSDGFFVDFFLYYKAVFITLVAVIIILLFIGEHVFPDRKIASYQLRTKKMHVVYICCGGYLLLVLASFLFSEYKFEGIFGLPTECEGIFVLVSYIVILFAGIQYFGNEKSLKIFRTALVLFTVLWIGASLIELLYKPLFEIGIFQNMLAPEQYREALKTMKNEEYQGMITLAMYNPNYYGGMCVLLFPFLYTSFLEDKTKKRWGYLLLSVGILICTIASKSTAPLYCVIIEILKAGILVLRARLKSLKKVILFFLCFLFILLIMSTLTKGTFLRTLNQTLTNTGREENKKDKFILKKLDMQDSQIKLTGESNDLVIEANPEQAVKAESVVFKDTEGKVLNRLIQGTKVGFEDNRYINISIDIQEFFMLIDLGYDTPLRFYVTTEGFKGVGPNGTVLEKVGYEEEINRFDSFATGRGYTWSRILPVLKECIIIGKGPGTFPYYFPQFDYVGLLNTHGSADFVIDKAHNMYLQIWVHTGLISLLCLFVLFIWIIFNNIRLKRKDLPDKENGITEIVRKGSLVSIAGWLICAFVNDSIVTVSPMFWFVTGINIAIIIMLKQENMLYE